MLPHDKEPLDEQDVDGNEVELSENALSALQQFYSEREENEQRFQDLKAALGQQAPHTPLSMDMFMEDWNASQFWYTEETAVLLARQLLEGAASDSHIAVISAPSVFIQLKNLLAKGSSNPPQICLLEFDQRFGVFEEFVHYDFQSPTKLPSQ
ncbi:MAG: hypothetical protein LQ351_004009 [Letrouitia transgressa]|nr:MAG: hypothetical protein LQ351_004009 [Letrouitia transgressa]